MLTSERIDSTSTALWGLVLAAGDGTRLRGYVRQVTGTELPKQYVNFIGKRSMLEHTFHRAERLIPAKRVLSVVGRHHLAHEEVRRQLSIRPAQTVIVQPDNKETGPGILLPLMHLYKRAPQAIVAVFPSDHFVLEENHFIEQVHLAAQAVTQDAARIVVLAVQANKPETEYGYIVPRKDSYTHRRFGTQRVSCFVEKPNADLAFELVMTGGLWNTMTMVFKLKTLFDLVRRILPGMYFSFRPILEAIGTPAEQRTINQVYKSLEPVNFSKAILARIATRFPDRLAVLAVPDVLWSDWGSRERIHQVIIKMHERRVAKARAAADLSAPLGL